MADATSRASSPTRTVVFSQHLPHFEFRSAEGTSRGVFLIVYSNGEAWFLPTTAAAGSDGALARLRSASHVYTFHFEQPPPKIALSSDCRLLLLFGAWHAFNGKPVRCLLVYQLLSRLVGCFDGGDHFKLIYADLSAPFLDVSFAADARGLLVLLRRLPAAVVRLDLPLIDAQTAKMLASVPVPADASEDAIRSYISFEPRAVGPLRLTAGLLEPLCQLRPLSASAVVALAADRSQFFVVSTSRSQYQHLVAASMPPGMTLVDCLAAVSSSSKHTAGQQPQKHHPSSSNQDESPSSSQEVGQPSSGQLLDAPAAADDNDAARQQPVGSVCDQLIPVALLVYLDAAEHFAVLIVTSTDDQSMSGQLFPAPETKSRRAVYQSWATLQWLTADHLLLVFFDIVYEFKRSSPLHQFHMSHEYYAQPLQALHLAPNADSEFFVPWHPACTADTTHLHRRDRAPSQSRKWTAPASRLQLHVAARPGWCEAYSALHLYRCWSCARVLLKPLQCGRCRTVAYCSPECQQQHWPDHKPACSPPTAKFQE